MMEEWVKGTKEETNRQIYKEAEKEREQLIRERKGRDRKTAKE